MLPVEFRDPGKYCRHHVTFLLRPIINRLFDNTDQDTIMIISPGSFCYQATNQSPGRLSRDVIAPMESGGAVQYAVNAHSNWLPALV